VSDQSAADEREGDEQATVSMRDDGGLDLTGVSQGLAAVLLTLPATLDADAPPAVNKRLFPDVSATDEEANDEWRKLMHPELFHLLGSARDVIANDLRLLVMTCATESDGRLEIPGKHRDAWISGLQVARLAIAAHHGLDRYEAEIEPVPPELQRARDYAAATLDLFGELLWRLVSGALAELPEEGRTPFENGDD